uniref:NADH dehydrogenase subunit 4L n=1 Tax=Liposcelis nr. bostrychophila AZ TaxID=1643344 RepID=A0A0F6RA74_9NEOP|nr:NADH dehydrogenase subunit 4L [Liposcelis nr. bostrychophila AZ]
MIWMFILLFSLIFKLNILSIILNFEMIMIFIFISMYNMKSKILMLMLIFLIISEGVVGLVFCMKWAFIYCNLKISSNNLSKL